MTSGKSKKKIPSVKLSEVEPEKIRWLWKGYIPYGKITILDGDPSATKTTLAINIAALVTSGRPMPLRTKKRKPCSVLYLSAEDGIADTLHARFEVAGADAKRVEIPRFDEGVRIPTIPEDVPLIEDLCISSKAKLVVFDPISAFIPQDVNTHRDAAVRNSLVPLMALGQRNDAAILALRHLNKMPGTAAIYRGGGSIAFAATARSVLLAGRSPDDPGARVLTSVKCNLHLEPPSILYEIEDVQGVPRIRWLGRTELTADQLVGLTEKTSSAIDDAVAFLEVLLANGPVPVTKVYREATKLGITKRTLDRAKKKLGIRPTKTTFDGGWKMSLPNDNDQDC